MASRRHVVPTPELRSNGFFPILGKALAPAPPAAAAPTAGSAEPPPVVGISTEAVDIVSSRGASIGTEKVMEAITDMIERVANNNAGQRSASPGDGDGGGGTAAVATCTSSGGSGGGGCVGTRKRRLLPPEIVFPGAYVAIRFRLSDGGVDGSIEEEFSKKGDEKKIMSSSTAKTLEIRFDARSALAEWAEAHGPLVDVHQAFSSNIAPVSGESSSTASGSTVSSSVGGVDGPEGSRGVVIMKTIDAQLWERGRGAGGSSSGAPSAATVMGTCARPVPVKGPHKPSTNAPTKSSDISLASSIHSTPSASASASDFRYDWTYSSPYAGTLVYRGDASTTCSSEDTAWHGPALLNGRNLWTSIACSGIDLALLSDRSQPILYFDDVTLYEDDLHDNGVSQINVKIRVMPKCLFVLYRLVVRVDYVTVRCRDVRVYHRFGTQEVFRDVTWRECKWGSLIATGLPDDVGRWRVEGAVDATALASVQALLGRLPKQTLPSDIPEHSKFELA